ncbi:hypothetical protein ES703_111012 [subsurface metagenome]
MQNNSFQTKKDISKKIFWIILISLVLIRITMVLFLMQDIPHTGVELGGWRFYPDGDEGTYFNFAKPMSQFRLVEGRQMPMGFPLFLAPFIYFTKAETIEDVLKPIVIVHAFLLFSLSIVLIGLMAKRVFRSKIIGSICAGIFTFHPYIFYLFFRHLGPYYPEAELFRGEVGFLGLNWLYISSDPLSAFLVYLCFFLFFIGLVKNNPKYSLLMLVGILSGFSVMVRISNILIVGIFILGWLLRKRIKEAVLIGGFSFFTILPQLIYNYIFFGSPLKTGYQVYLSHYPNVFSMFSLARWPIIFEKANFYIPGFIFLLPFFIILLILGTRYLLKKDKIIGLIIVFWFFAYFLFYGSWIEAGIQPRFFIPAVPPLIFITVAAFLWIFSKIKKSNFLFKQ